MAVKSNQPVNPISGRSPARSSTEFMQRLREAAKSGFEDPRKMFSTLAQEEGWIEHTGFSPQEQVLYAKLSPGQTAKKKFAFTGQFEGKTHIVAPQEYLTARAEKVLGILYGPEEKLSATRIRNYALVSRAHEAAEAFYGNLEGWQGRFGGHVSKKVIESELQFASTLGTEAYKDTWAKRKLEIDIMARDRTLRDANIATYVEETRDLLERYKSKPDISRFFGEGFGGVGKVEKSVAKAPVIGQAAKVVTQAEHAAPVVASLEKAKGLNKYFKVGLGLGAGIATFGLLFSGRDDNYNTIPGMQHGGLGAELRRQNTDFGSGYVGLEKAIKDHKDKQTLEHEKNLFSKIKYAGFLLGAPAYLLADTKQPSETYQRLYGGRLGKIFRHVPAAMFAAGEAVDIASGKTTATGAAIGVAAWFATSWALKPAFGRLGKRVGHAGAMDLFDTAAGSLAYVAGKHLYNFFSGHDDAHNTIEGLPEKGVAGTVRKVMTDFGSGYQGQDKKSHNITDSMLLGAAAFGGAKAGIHFALLRNELSDADIKKYPRLQELRGIGEKTGLKIAAERLGGFKPFKDSKSLVWNFDVWPTDPGFLEHVDVPNKINFGSWNIGADKWWTQQYFKEKGLSNLWPKAWEANDIFNLEKHPKLGEMWIEGKLQAHELFRLPETQQWLKERGGGENLVLKKVKSALGEGVWPKGIHTVPKEIWEDVLLNPEQYMFQERLKLEAEYRAVTVGGKSIFETHRFGSQPHNKLLNLVEKTFPNFVEKWKAEHYHENIEPVLDPHRSRALREFAEQAHEALPKGLDITAWDIGLTKEGKFKIIEMQRAFGTARHPLVAARIKEALTGKIAHQNALTKWKIPAVIGGAAAIVGLSLFSGKDDEYNTIEGLRHGGEAEKSRRRHTEFGSGWMGLFGRTALELSEFGFLYTKRRYSRDEEDKPKPPPSPKYYTSPSYISQIWTSSFQSLYNDSERRLPIENAAINRMPGGLHPHGPLSRDENEFAKILHGTTPFRGQHDRLKHIAQLAGKELGEVLASKAFHEALQAGTLVQKLKSGQYGTVSLFKTMVEGQPLHYVKKTILSGARESLIQQVRTAYEKPLQAAEEGVRQAIGHVPIRSEELLGEGPGEFARLDLLQNRREITQHYKQFAPGLNLEHEARMMRAAGHEGIVPTVYGVSEGNLYQEAAGVYNEETGDFRLAKTFKEMKEVPREQRTLVPKSSMSQIIEQSESNIKKGVLNWDVHGGNLLIDEPTGRVWNVDYGVAKKIRPGTRHEVVQKGIEDLKYRLKMQHSILEAPEQVQGLSFKVPDPEANIESISVPPPRLPSLPSSSELAAIQKGAQHALFSNAAHAGRKHVNAVSNRVRKARDPFSQ